MSPALNILRRDIHISGAVQGVGFRPFVYRTASAFGVKGWVRNDSQGVTIRALGSEDLLERFQRALRDRAPEPARIREIRVLAERSVEDEDLSDDFRILDSEMTEDVTASISPDLAICAECLRELMDEKDRRYRYPFINCTACGPRYSILESIPYDRAHTTMRDFQMCEQCAREYEDPADRRYHAQPNACPACGPHVALWSPSGREMAAQHDALILAADGIREGRIVAVKGLGGFHLMADARNEDALKELRRRKGREEKPLALMFPWMALIREACDVNELEARTLAGPEAPIVLLRKRQNSTCGLAGVVAPGNPFLGVMLPYTALHYLLMHELGIPVVATSGNRTDEPLCIDEREALQRLEGIADLFLVHDRPIARPVDDSVVRVAAGRLTILRRARGYAPRPVLLDQAVPEPMLAVGAHQKNAVALALGTEAFISQHVGDLDTAPAFRAFEETVRALSVLYCAEPRIIACDQHPDYASTRFARETDAPVRVIPIQHHHAHIVSCMVDNRLDGRVLGVAWDGTGYGSDGTVWGGEFLLADRRRYERIGHLRTFPLPGGDAAAREPRRAALGLLYELGGPEMLLREDIAPLRDLKPEQSRILRQMLQKEMQTPHTSSVGRLFDAVAALLDVRQDCTYEGQAAMELEHAAWRAPADTPPYAIPFSDGQADWAPMIGRILEDLKLNRDKDVIARSFHEGLARLIVDMARLADEPRVVLSGGCFQNALLLERAVALLTQAGYTPYWHHQVPPNDGGIALGQLAIALNTEH